MKKDKNQKKLTLKSLRISRLESRESPLGGRVCSADALGCQTETEGAYNGLDLPPEFQATVGKGGTSDCLFSFSSPPALGDQCPPTYN
jgi:hypothetical protein